MWQFQVCSFKSIKFSYSFDHFLASLLPPAVNSGLLFAYSLLAATVTSIGATHSPSNNITADQHYSIPHCPKYIDNDYHPLYTCELAREAAILAGSSLLLTIVNIICIIITALLILRVKEVVPLHQPNEDVTHFFHHDVKVTRDYNKTLHANDLESNPSANSTVHRSHLARSILARWRMFKSMNSSAHQDIEQAPTTKHDGPVTDLDTDKRRDLLNLKMFSKGYDLNPFDKVDYDLITPESREKVRLLINDLLDMYEEVPPVFIGLFHLHSYATRSNVGEDDLPFYEEFIRLLPPKWYQIFLVEQRRRQMPSRPSSLYRTYSLRTPKQTRHHQSTLDSNENHYHSLSSQLDRTGKRATFQRQTSMSVDVDQENETEVPIHGTRFRIARLPTTNEVSETKLEDD